MRSFQLTLSIEWNNQMNDNVLNNLLYYRFSILILNTRKITQAYVKLLSCFFLVIMNEMKEANYHQRENHPGVVWYDPVPAEVTQSFHISGFHLDNYNPANHQSKLIHDLRRKKKKFRQYMITKINRFLTCLLNFITSSFRWFRKRFTREFGLW